jgi:hypothetical protein
MWKQVIETLWQTLRLAEDTQQNRQDIKELEKQMRDFATATEQKINDLQRVIERLAAAIERLGEREEAERRILKLELENQLLRAERGLPPAKSESPAEETNRRKEDSVDPKTVP